MSNHLQGTEAWFKEREGKLTASAFGQAAGLGPGSRQQLWRRLMKLEEFHGNAATDWGTEHEPVALSAYQVATGSLPDLVGFVPHPALDWLGGSPDLLVGAEGMGEIKCPVSQALYPSIPPYYLAQVQGLLEVTDRKWCDFICWTPDAMSITRVWRSPAYWDWLHLRLAEFWTFVQAQIEPPRASRPKPPDLDTAFIGHTQIINFSTTERTEP